MTLPETPLAEATLMSTFKVPSSSVSLPGAAHGISRRRALTLFGAAAGFTLISKNGAIALPEGVSLYTWEGRALGAPAKLTLAHYDRTVAERIVTTAVNEIERLESIFSLHRVNSNLSILNRDGHIDAPGTDLLSVLSNSVRFGDQTDGAFDITVQPLWHLFSEHFATQPDIQTGPSSTDIQTALDLVGYEKIDISKGKVRFAKQGMAVTLNGIAQGYITDRVADLLRDQGIEQVLVELGETRALNDHPDGRPWRIGLADPADPSKTTETIEITNESVATSAGSGTVFDGNGHYHHLFDPRNGKPTKHHISASVITKRATTADAMSTALFVLPTSKVEDVVMRIGGMKAVITTPEGKTHRFVS